MDIQREDKNLRIRPLTDNPGNLSIIKIFKHKSKWSGRNFRNGWRTTVYEASIIRDSVTRTEKFLKTSRTIIRTPDHTCTYLFIVKVLPRKKQNSLEKDVTLDVKKMCKISI